MIKYSRRTLIYLACGVHFAAGIGVRAQTNSRDIGIDESHFKYVGTESACRRCHEKGLSDRDRNNGIDSRVLLSEWDTWHNADKHAHAFTALKEERGQRMAALLKKDIFAPSTGCIQCHISNTNLELWDSKCGTQDLATNTCVSEGIGCEACHGPASKWVGPHTFGDWWKLSDKEKAAEGFRPIRNPRYKAELCLSCHLGNPSEDKQITHEMYAAGHPPLSGFELESFVNRMPRHWRQSYEKNEASKRYERTRNLLIGNVTAFRLAFECAAADAADENQADRWPEFARLECYSCHHDLQLPSWRQVRSMPGKVGRPYLDVGCVPMVAAAAYVANGEAGRREAEELIARVQKEIFQKNIFGEPTAVTRIHPIVQAWCAELEAKLMDVPLDTELVTEILDGVFEIASQDLRDYDTARQLSGTIMIIATELSKIDPEQAISPAVRDRLETLQGWFNLHQDSLRQIEESLSDSLKHRAEFEPKLFAKLISSMRQSRRD